MESEIARIAWRMEALAAELESPVGQVSAPPPQRTPMAPPPAAIGYPPAAQNWFANVMQASAMGMEAAPVSREVVYLADVTQRTFVGVLRRLGDLERRIDGGPVQIEAEISEPGVALDLSYLEEPVAPEPTMAPFEVADIVGGIAQELGALDAKLDECKILQLSVIEVGEQLQGLCDRLEHLEQASEEPNPLVEALVESAARFQLLDAKLDSLANTHDVARLVERLGLTPSEMTEEPTVGDVGEDGAIDHDGEGTGHLAVLEDLPFDDRAPDEANERWSLFRRSMP